jgi:hypothetical protein
MNCLLWPLAAAVTGAFGAVAALVGKTLPPKEVPFDSIEEVQRFVSEYFGKKVVKVKPNDFPDPEDL